MLNYDMPLYRPPSEGNNLIIQATLGCSYNQCSFCSMYHSKRYQERPFEMVANEIREAVSLWPKTRRVFLADGDALALPSEQLLAILLLLKSSFPQLTRVSCYATPINLLRKSAEELQQLQQAGLTLLYFGIESGSNLILKKITKGATQRGMVTALTKAQRCGFKVSATVVLGLGGTTHWQRHIDGTIELLNQAPVNYLSTLQLYLEESASETFRQRFGEPFIMQNDQAILQEQRRLLSGLEPPQATIFRSNHASNALALAGNLPKDRAMLLQQLEQAIEGERALRRTELRGL
ncbi:MAG: radical SAM protein [Candidatus Polarisedimenticolaceae bacterium]|nr:radical SAM protein [Candidatus Polarisedimenticolaceae bacterium]